MVPDQIPGNLYFGYSAANTGHIDEDYHHRYQWNDNLPDSRCTRVIDKTQDGDSPDADIPVEVYYRYDAFGRRVGHYYKWPTGSGNPASLPASSEFHDKELVYDGVMLVEEWYADSAPAALQNKLKRRYYKSA